MNDGQQKTQEHQQPPPGTAAASCADQGEKDADADTPVAGIAALHPHTGALDRSWDARFRLIPDAGVFNALVVRGDRVFAAGTFRVSGLPRNGLVALDARTGVPDRLWAPKPPDCPVCRGFASLSGLAASAERVYASGSFSRFDGIPRNGVVALDPRTGAVDRSWRPARGGHGILTVALAGGRLYLGTMNGLLALDAGTGAALRAPKVPFREVFPLVPSGRRLLVGGRSPMSPSRLALVLALLVLAGCGGEPPAQDDENAAAEAEAQGDLSFVPATYREGDRVILPIRFPDGTSAELVYPPELAIAELGAVPYSSGTLHGKRPLPERSDYVGRDFVIRYGGLEEVLEAFSGNRSPRLLARYQGVDRSSVGLWDVPGNDNVHYLGFQFGRWAVLVYDYIAGGGQMTEAERAS